MQVATYKKSGAVSTAKMKLKDSKSYFTFLFRVLIMEG